VQERLGGDAPAVQTGSADLVLLDQRDPLAQFGRPQCAGVAAATATQYDHVVPVAALSHWKAPCRIGVPPESGPGTRIFSLARTVRGPLARPVRRDAVRRRGVRRRR